MQTKLVELLGGAILGGSTAGKEAFVKLVNLAVEEEGRWTPWFWNLSGVEVVSASFARECFVAMRGYLRAQRSYLMPVVANASRDVLEDLRLAFKEAGQSIVTCRIGAAGRPQDVALIGDVDAHVGETFALVVARGVTDARELAGAQNGAHTIGQTGWNNRLSGLAQMGVVVETLEGRTKRYRAILQGD